MVKRIGVSDYLSNPITPRHSVLSFRGLPVRFLKCRMIHNNIHCCNPSGWRAIKDKLKSKCRSDNRGNLICFSN